MGVRLLFIGVTALMIVIGATANADTIGIATGASSNWLTSAVFEPISLPEILRPTLGVDHEEPASAEEPTNLQDPAVHPDEVLKSLQESVQRLSAAGLAEEAAAATRLLQQFEQKYQSRLILALQSSESAKHRAELDCLQRRLAKFDIDAEDGRRGQTASELRAYQVNSSAVRYWVRDNGVDNIPRTEFGSLNNTEVLEAPIRISDSYKKTVHLIDDMTATYRLLESINRRKDNYPVQR